MKSAAKLNHKWDRKERQKQRLTSAPDMSGWVWADGETPPDYRNPCQVNMQQVFHSTPQTNMNISMKCQAVKTMISVRRVLST